VKTLATNLERALIPAAQRAGEPPPAPQAVAGGELPRRIEARGKFLFAGAEKFYIRGVTYGPFRPGPDGCQYGELSRVRSDFALMAKAGVNAVRTYTMPPLSLLDAAAESGLRVFLGWPWEQHVAFLDGETPRALERRIRTAVRNFAGHPAVLAYAIGNEIPSPLVRWYGRPRIEKFLERLYCAAKEEDPDTLVTYVNYPSTEYLELPFLDFVSFNVYLESQPKLEAYSARLQNIAGERPLVMAEIGLDSLRHGESGQAGALEWQTRTLFASGCAGLFVFAWTDEWHRGGHDIEDWNFGLVRRDQQPKPALEAVRGAFQTVPFETDKSWPAISVVVCSSNGARTIRQTLEALRAVKYPRLEIIVVDDGSTDNTAQIAGEFEAQLIRTTNQGLSAARNVGWQRAKGEIVAYLDDDAMPDQHWLQYLASMFMAHDYAGVGGPNLGVLEDRFVAQCVDHAPGNPTHVLLTDREAEHLPGCNMAFRRACLEAIGGFDPQFRIAGDDVDLCWRLRDRGLKLGFHAGAMVWHHRRGTWRGYWRQQTNYGRAEAILERKWPEKYNAAGHMIWSGRLYSKGFWQMFRWTQRIYHGSWGTALFQSVYSIAPGRLRTLLTLPEWYLLIALVTAIAAVGIFYPPLRFAFGLLVLMILPPAVNALLSGASSLIRRAPRGGWERLRLAIGAAALHFLQPAARLAGRLRQGLTPWRARGTARAVFPEADRVAIWSEGQWRGSEERLTALEAAMKTSGAVVVRGGDYDRWDLEVRGGLLGTARAQLVIEEHGDGKQLVRLRFWPVFSAPAMVAVCLFSSLAMVAALDLAWVVWGLFNAPALILLGRATLESGMALAVMRAALPSVLNPGEKMVES
jgi:O-antigen biosynthesis protein